MPDDVAELEERRRVLRSLLRWDEDNFLAHVQLGLAILKLAELSPADPAEGVGALDRALALRPNHTVANFLLGRALWQTGQDKARALRHLDIALAGDGGRLQSHRLSELADIYLAARQPAKALEAMDSIQVKARALDKNSHAWLVRATAQAVLGKGESAKQSLYYAKLLARVRDENICTEVAAIERLLPEAGGDAMPCRPSPASAADSATPEN
jgi:tetratricopeptide (TPR) repeat protein